MQQPSVDELPALVVLKDGAMNVDLGHYTTKGLPAASARLSAACTCTAQHGAQAEGSVATSQDIAEGRVDSSAKCLTQAMTLINEEAN